MENVVLMHGIKPWDDGAFDVEEIGAAGAPEKETGNKEIAQILQKNADSVVEYKMTTANIIRRVVRN